MPGFITHLTFGEQTLSFLKSNNTKTLLEKHNNVFNLGLQGPDIFFYHIPAYIFYKKNIGNVMHRSKTMLFFDALLDGRNNFDNVIDQNVCDAYIIGFIGHYTLDVACHPYIYYRSDHFNNLKRSGIYDFGKHVSLETDIDHIILDYYHHMLPSQFDYRSSVKPNSHEHEIISELLFFAINKTYPEYHLRLGTISHAINSFCNLNHAMHDPDGKKKQHIRKIEQLFFGCAVISSMIPSDKKIKYNDPCNKFHNEWHNPWYPQVPRTESVIDLINRTMPDYIKRIELYVNAIEFSAADMTPLEETNYFLHQRNLLLAELSDLSYLSGLPIEEG